MFDATVIPRAEHPRPDMMRKDWLNLNGWWQFEIDDENTGMERGLVSGKDLAQKILVPFCPESKLSGIGHTDFMTHVWYRRNFSVPETMQGKRILLHFEAVDFEAKVWINGKLAGEHRGGYCGFVLDITHLLCEGENELVVQVFDDTRSGLQATGKQSQKLESYGCCYTRTTGIWQTVWLEAVGDTYVKEFFLTPDVEGERVFLQISINGKNAGYSVKVQAFAEGEMVAEDAIPAAWRNTLAQLSITAPRLWSIEDPFLYDLKISLEKDGQIIDQVESYFGMRKIHIDGNRFLINDKPVFQRTILDQGFYPDGIYTATSDEELKRDIELSMAAGFNGARLHQKVFEPRFLYWADKLGYIIWGEYPSWGVNLSNPQALTQVAVEWNEILRRDRNHPSIVGWCPLNETDASDGALWGQQLMATTMLIDPTRPWLDTSGYIHLVPETDIYDCHNYEQDPVVFAAAFEEFNQTGKNPYNNFPNERHVEYMGQPFFVSEYGGTRLSFGESEGEAWGYGTITGSIDEFLVRYKALTDALLDDPNMFGFCYTQLTDVEQEQNGIYFYDRSPKYDPTLLHAINFRTAAYETDAPRVTED